VAGVLAAVLAAFFAVPAHAEAVHDTMYWRLGSEVATVALFALAVFLHWRGRAVPLSTSAQGLGLVGAVLLVVASSLGGHLVYHGAGVDPHLLAPRVRGGHSRGGGHEHSGQPHYEERGAAP
jgi:uncharacterized membrane protein